MEQLTFLEIKQNKKPKNAQQRTEYERGIAEAMSEYMSREDALEFTQWKDKTRQAFWVKIRLADTVSPEWLQAFTTPQSIDRIARHVKAYCKNIILAA